MMGKRPDCTKVLTSWHFSFLNGLLLLQLSFSTYYLLLSLFLLSCQWWCSLSHEKVSGMCSVSDTISRESHCQCIVNYTTGGTRPPFFPLRWIRSIPQSEVFFFRESLAGNLGEFGTFERPPGGSTHTMLLANRQTWHLFELQLEENWQGIVTMIFDSMASPSPNHYDGKTGKASWNFTRKNSKRDEPACRSTRRESIRSKQCRGASLVFGLLTDQWCCLSWQFLTRLGPGHLMVSGDFCLSLSYLGATVPGPNRVKEPPRQAASLVSKRLFS